MAQVHVLNKQQQKNSLKAKKKNKKVVCALNSPYEYYYPLLNFNDNQILCDVLNKQLLKLNRDKVKIPWALIKKLQKKERKEFKENYIKTKLGVTSLPSTKINRDGLLLGINDITKSLEEQLVKSILITSDIKPWSMVEHVINQAVISNVPVLIVSNLRDILKEKCNISSTSIAFTDSIKYQEIQNVIEKISTNYPISKNYINTHRRVPDHNNLSSNNIIAVNDETTSTFTSHPIELKPIIDAHQQTKENDKNIDEVIESANLDGDHVYLHRTNLKERVFIPKPILIKEEIENNILEKHLENSNLQNKEKENNYYDIKIKKVNGDINRNKRKLELKIASKPKKKKLQTKNRNTDVLT